MKKYIAGTLLAGLLIAFIGIKLSSTDKTDEPILQKTVQVSTPQTNEEKIAELLKLTNEERAKAGVEPLVLDTTLNQSAQAKAEDMVTNNYFDHVNPVTGKSLVDLKNNSNCSYVGENISPTNWATAVIGSFMGSKLGHREALLDTKYDSVGFGIAGDYTVQHFCDYK